MTEAVKVYHYMLCPFSRKLRMILRELGANFELYSEAFWERRKSFLKLTPAGDTPVIVLKGGQVLWGNQALTEYLQETAEAEATAAISLLPKDPRERAAARQMTEWFDVKFYNEVGKYMLYEKVIKSVASLGYPNSQALQVAKSNISYHLEFIGHVRKKQMYLGGEEISIADFAAAAQLSVVDYLGEIPWKNHPMAKEWYALMKSRPSFQMVLGERLPVIQPPSYYSDPDF